MLLASAVVALVLAELLLRLLGLPSQIASFRFLGPELGSPAVFETDPDRFWRLRSDTREYRANSLGLRGPLVTAAKQPHDLRIACLGDSCTFGSGVRLEETYGWRLQEGLQQRLPDHRVQVILAALPGYSSYQDRVLFDQVVAPRRPDLTVIYAGGYNDYVPAIGDNDAARAARLHGERNSPWRGLHLWRLFQRAQGTGRSTEEYLEMFRKGEAPDGRRVPLPDFRDNLRRMVQGARAVGSAVVLLDPPLPESTVAAYPIARDYKAAVREVAGELAVTCVDADALFRELLPDGRKPPPLPPGFDGFWPCFVDWVHPSVAGHGLLADHLLKVSDTWVPSWRRKPAAPGSVPRPGAFAWRPVAEGPLRTGVGAVLELTLPTGFALPGDARIQCGPWWMPLPTMPATGPLTLRLWPWIPPGRHPLRLVLPGGNVQLERQVDLAPAHLEASISRTGKKLKLRFQIAGPAGCNAGVWVGVAKRERPAATRFGPMHLAATPDGVPAGFLGPFIFPRLQLPKAAGTVGDDGWWRQDSEVDMDRLGVVPERVFVQGILRRDGAHGVLTGVVELVVPR